MRNHQKKWFRFMMAPVIIMALLAVPAVLSTNVRLLLADVLGLTTVTLVDNDEMGFGVDGRDFSVSWTAANLSEVTTFVEYKVYLIPELAPAPDVNTVNNYVPVMANINQIAQTMWMGPQFLMMDSGDGTNPPAPLAAGNYVACVLAVGSDNQLIACSDPTAITSDVVVDTFPPFIEHPPVSAAIESADAILYANVFDNQSVANDFANGTNDAFFKLYYDNTLSSSVDGVLTENVFQFTVPAAAVPAAGGTFRYYLTAQDKDGNVKFLCSDQMADAANECAANPFMVNTLAAGQRSISGTINSGGNPLENALVYLGGFAKAAVTTDAQGAYSLSGLPNNFGYEVRATKAQYCENFRFENIQSSDLTNINLNLNAGACFFDPSGGGSSGKPHAVFSGPPSFANNVSLTENIRVGFDQPLSAQTVNDSDATDPGSASYLTTDGNNRVPGTVTYCENQSSPGCGSLFQMDQNVILFNPTADLSTNTFYTFVMEETVTSEGGQSIDGNRPGGGHQFSFNTGGGMVNFDAQNFGTGGLFMPPYIQAMNPGTGAPLSANSNILIHFNEPMDTTTLTTNNIKLLRGAADVTITLAVDTTNNKTVIVNPASDLQSGDHEIQVLGAVANASGVTMRGPGEATRVAFSAHVNVSGTDNMAPTIYPMLSNNSTDVPVNDDLEFGFSESLNGTTVTSSNITLKKGATVVPIAVEYDPNINNVRITPNTVLANNSVYTVTFTTDVKDLADNTLLEQTFTYTTGAADTQAPKLTDVRCDDFGCMAFFDEPMNSKTSVDGALFDSSVLNNINFTLQLETAPGSNQFAADIIAGGSATLSYNSDMRGVEIKNIGLTASDRGKKALFTANAALKDISNNGISTGNGINDRKTVIEDNTKTFGNFGGAAGGGSMMFGPPSNAIGTEFKPEGFGTFTGEQFAFGQVDMAFPFNPTASQDSNVFQVRTTFDEALEDGDQIKVTFPTGTGIQSLAQDSFSPFQADMNGFNAGVITFDGTLDNDGILVDANARIATIQLDVTGTPEATAAVTLDMKGAVNPSIPKDYTSGGYTVGIKLVRDGVTLANKTSMPYFIMPAGNNAITLKVYAGSQQTPVGGANGTGTVYMRGGGPNGPQDKLLSLTDGVITAADGVAIANDDGVQLTGLNDGCYFFGVEDATLGNADYIGRQSPEPICVNGGQTVSKTIVLTAASGSAVAPLTVKLDGIANFGGRNIDLPAGGPNSFTIKTLENVGVPNADGYTVNLSSNGTWFVGVAPSMGKGSSNKMPEPLPGTPPPPVQLNVSGIGDSPVITTVGPLPPGVTYTAQTSTLTFTFAAANKTFSGRVTDGNAPLSGIQLFVRSQGFGVPTYATTKADGTFTISVSDYGSYALDLFKDGGGMPPVNSQIEVRQDSANDPDNNPDVYYKGKLITEDNQLEIKMKKPSKYISGSVVDLNSNKITNAPIIATNSLGEVTYGGTDSTGNYTLFVEPGTWTLRPDLPPDKTDVCGTFSKSVTVTSENQTSQNITPSLGSCYNISGALMVGGTEQANKPISITEWDTENDRPVAGGFSRFSSTDSDGNYQIKAGGNKTYRVGSSDPNFGEISTLVEVAAANVNNADVDSGQVGDITFAFTDGAAAHEAFIEIKKGNDKHTRFGRNKRDLSSNVVFSNVQNGSYAYSVNVFGISSFSGTANAGDTVTIDLSTSALNTITGLVEDSNGVPLTGVLVTVIEQTSGVVLTNTTDATGAYSLALPDGTYTIKESLAGYVPAEAPGELVVADDMTFNFADGGDHQPLEKATAVLSGTIKQSDDNTPVTDGYVTATNSEGVAVVVPIDPQDGSYDLPVTDDAAWTIQAVAPLHGLTEKVGTVAVSGADVTNQNITLEADETRTSDIASKALAGNVGGSINDSHNTGVVFTTGPGELQAGSGNVTVSIEKAYVAPETSDWIPLDNASFSISAIGSGSSSIKDLNGFADLQIDFTDMLATLPSDVQESDLKLVWFSPEVQEWIPLEGGFTIDETNNIIAGQTDHLTDFAIVYSTPTPTPAPADPAPAAPAADTTGGGNAGGGGGGKAKPVTVQSKTEQVAVAEGSAEAAMKPAASVVAKGKDYSKHWAANYVQQLYDSGAVTGCGNGNYCPDFDITRAEMLKIAMNVFGITEEKGLSNSFNDLRNHWSKDYVLTAAKAGIVKGYADKGFHPDGKVTRAEGLKILLEAAKLPLMDTTDLLNPFLDLKRTIWSYAYVLTAYNKSMIGGYDMAGKLYFKPDQSITRAEIAKIAVLVKDLMAAPK